MTLPNFLIIGAAKSGTTALYRYLYDHPQIFMSERKELHYFSYPETSKLTRGPDTYHRIAVSTLEEYKSYFNDVKGQAAIGEASPTYLYFPSCALRIKKTLPDVKLIAILRNPVERAYSAFMHAVRDGWEPLPDFSSALAQEQDRIKDGWEIVWHYTQAGFYHRQLTHYYEQFDKSQIKVFLYDDLVNDPIKLYKEVTGFLEVDESFIPDFSVHPNVSGRIRSQLVYDLANRLFLQPNLLKSLSRRMLPEKIRWRFTTRVRNMNINKEPFPEEVRAKLVPIFRSDISQLQELIGRDLSHWLT
jgi:hypothetical protein